MSPPESLCNTPAPAVRRAAVLLAKSAITGAADGEMQRWTERMQRADPQLHAVRHAYSEQGTPSLREVLLDLVAEGVDELALLPLLVPMEPGYRLWITRSVARWREAAPQLRWPQFRLAPAPGESEAGVEWLDAWLRSAGSAAELPEPPPEPLGSVVPAQQRRVLVCQGGPCNDAGAAVVWGHLRNEQKRLNLRTVGTGTMTCKTTCLGPCQLAPVLQVFPEGTYYGGVDEAGIDRIVQEHLLGGQVVADLAYEAVPGRQRLRSTPPADGTAKGQPAAAEA